MDPLSALAIAAAAFQFLELGGQLCVKGWKKYKQLQQGVASNQQLVEEEKELRKTFEELSDQISWFRQISAGIVVSQDETRIQKQLLRLSSHCVKLSSDFERMKNKMMLPIRQTIKPAREKNGEKADVEGIEDEMKHINENLELLKEETMGFILLSLWDNSERSKHWELHFSNQLEKLIELLESAGNISVNNPQKSVSWNQMTSIQIESPENHMQQSGAIISVMADEETARLRNALQPLIQLGNGPVSLEQLANGVVECLQRDSVAMNTVRRELINILWKNDWKLDASMTVTKIDTVVVADAIATGIQFRNLQTREDAISKTFEKTYAWIFQDEPPKTHNTPLWDSFPKWLKDDSNKVYWITGKPGSGKSTIMKLISRQSSVKDLLCQSLGSLRLLLIKYYAWHPGHTLQKSLQGLKRATIFQALQQYPDLAPVLTPRRWAFCQVLRNTSGLPTWDTKEVEESFEALLSSCGETIKLALLIDGLDEFEMPPVEVIECIQHMITRCPRGLKICAASRPWPEFQDEFSDSPMLQMHLLTESDIKIFIDGKFKDNKGFTEQRQLYPEEASQLLMDICRRANGVFIWVSIVVKHLSNFFAEGQSISQARQILETLPTKISSLYDAIWADISPRILPEASDMMQLRKAFGGPMPWLTAWVIEESRFATRAINNLPTDNERKNVALKSLKRKLGARTKCILEISGSGQDAVIDFIHRTARDWAVQSENWQLICSSSNGQFDPHLSILKAETLLLSTKANLMGKELWDAIATALWRAGEVNDTPDNELDLIKCVNSIGKHFPKLLQMSKAAKEDVQNRDSTLFGRRESAKIVLSGKEERIRQKEQIRRLERRWQKERNIQHPLLWPVDPDFLGLAVQFSCLPYIRAIMLRSDLIQKSSEESLGLLENAIFGYYYFVKLSGDCAQPQIPCDRRLATVKYLLDRGVRQSRVHKNLSLEIYDLRKVLEEISPTDPEYYSAVEKYLNNTDYKSSMRSVDLRIRSLFSKT